MNSPRHPWWNFLTTSVTLNYLKCSIIFFPFGHVGIWNKVLQACSTSMVGRWAQLKQLSVEQRSKRHNPNPIPIPEQNRTEQGKKKTGEWFGIGLICNKKTLTKSNPWQLIKRKTRIHTPVQFNPIPVQNQSKEGGPTLWLFVVAFGPTQTCITCSVTKPWFLFYIFFWVYFYFPQICDAQIPDWLDSFGILQLTNTAYLRIFLAYVSSMGWGDGMGDGI